MTTLEDLMHRNWLVASYEGHAVVWNHSSTFTIYRLDGAGRAAPLETYTRSTPAGLFLSYNFRWEIYTGRELVKEMRGEE